MPWDRLRHVSGGSGAYSYWTTTAPLLSADHLYTLHQYGCQLDSSYVGLCKLLESADPSHQELAAQHLKECSNQQFIHQMTRWGLTHGNSNLWDILNPKPWESKSFIGNFWPFFVSDSIKTHQSFQSWRALMSSEQCIQFCDWIIEKIHTDIALMKVAGYRQLRPHIQEGMIKSTNTLWMFMEGHDLDQLTRWHKLMKSKSMYIPPLLAAEMLHQRIDRQLDGTAVEQAPKRRM